MGSIDAQLRSFSLTTDNRSGYRDFSTIALGGRLGYTTPFYKHFRASARVHYSMELWSNGLMDPDPATGKTSKWELELYDVADPSERRDINRLSEAYIQYKNNIVELTAGRQPLNTPFLNMRDGRMMPFGFGAVKAKVSQSASSKYELGWVYSATVRGFTDWNDLNSTIGTVGQGRTVDGDAARYLDSTATKGIGYAKYGWKGKDQQLQFWTFFIDRLNTSFWTEWNGSLNQWSAGIQGLVQVASPNSHYGYLQGNGRSELLSAKLVYALRKNGKITGAISRITKTGKFLFPRELGREHVFTSMPRNWLEGNGDLWAGSLEWCYRWRSSTGLRFRLKGLYINAAPTTTYALNKYGIRDHVQLNAQGRYTIPRTADRLEVELLYLIHRTIDATYSDPAREINRNNFQQINLITYYNIGKTEKS